MTHADMNCAEGLRTLAERAAVTFSADERVLSVVLKGSLCSGEADRWSDVDLSVVVADDGFGRYASGAGWLVPLGQIFALERITGDGRCTARICLMDFSRYDIVFLKRSSLGEPELQKLFGANHIVLFNREHNGGPFAACPSVPEEWQPSDEGTGLNVFADRFWFKAVTAVCKLGRGDHLISSHLALGMAQDTVVLQMMLRDRETGTDRHRYGGREAVAVLPGITGFQPGPDAGAAILHLMYEAAAVFDTLATGLSPDYLTRSMRFRFWADGILKA